MNRCLCVLIAMILGGCASQSPMPTTTESPKLPSNKNSKVSESVNVDSKMKPSELSQKNQTSVSSWELSGVMAAKNKNKAFSATVNWLQNGPNEYHIRLMGPLGSGSILIEKVGGVIKYQDGPKHVTASNADQLLQEQTGIRPPVNDLYYWIRGLQAPGKVQSAQYDSAHHLTVLKQNGFTINYMAYTAAGNQSLPSKLVLQGGGVWVKFVVKKWKI